MNTETTDDLDTGIRPRSAKFRKSAMLSTWDRDKGPGHPKRMPQILQDMVEDIERTEAMDFYDVGAHIGWYACHIGRTFKGVGIHAFDMNPAACLEIAENLKINKLAGHVICAAAYEAPGEYRGMMEYKVGHPATMYSTETKELTPTPYRVPTMSLAMYAHQTKSTPRVVKIDVQGDEDAAILGLIPVIRGNDKRAVYVRIGARDDERMVHKCVNLLEDHRFVVHRYDVDDTQIWRFRR